MGRFRGAGPRHNRTDSSAARNHSAAASRPAILRRTTAAREFTSLARISEIRSALSLTRLPRQLGGACASGKEGSVEFLPASLGDLRGGHP